MRERVLGWLMDPNIAFLVLAVGGLALYAQRLRERGVLALRAHLEAEVGARRRVLAETHERGRTEQFTPVRLSMRAAPGTILDLHIAGHDGRQLLAG